MSFQCNIYPVNSSFHTFTGYLSELMHLLCNLDSIYSLPRASPSFTGYLGSVCADRWLSLRVFFSELFFLYSFSTRFARLASPRLGSTLRFISLYFYFSVSVFVSLSLSLPLSVSVFLVIVRQKFLLNWN